MSSFTLYRVGHLLGAGGMAEVFYGQVEGAGGFLRPVAIKRVREAIAAEPAFLEAFASEAKLAARLNHPNIVSLIDYQHEACGAPFIVMEYIDGRELAALARKGPLPCSTALFIIAEVLRGLGHAHQLPVSTGLRGVVHRDVSPQNVLLSWQGAVKVSDFGIAKAFTTTHGAQSATLRGKPAYMSPEQVDNLPLDGRSDLFAVGVVLWELLTGRRLFDGEGTFREALVRVLHAPIPRPGEVAPQEIPADVEAVVMRLLQRDKALRYATAQEAISDVLRCETAPRDGTGELIELLHERLGGPPALAPMDIQALEPLTRTMQVAASEVPLSSSGSITGPSDLMKAPASAWRRRSAKLIAGLAASAVIASAVALATVGEEPRGAGPARRESGASATPAAAASAPRGSASAANAGVAGPFITPTAAPSGASTAAPSGGEPAAPASGGALVPPIPAVPAVRKRSAYPRIPGAALPPPRPATSRGIIDVPMTPPTVDPSPAR